jgi:hypothetical protein
MDANGREWTRGGGGDGYMSEPSIDVILERITIMQQDITDIKILLAKNDEKLHAAMVDRIRLGQETHAAHRRLDECQPRRELMERDIQEIRDVMRPLITANKIMAYLASALMASVLGLVWGLITGQVQLVIP